MTADVLRRHEDGILERVNDLLRTWDTPPLQRLSDLFAQVDRSFLATFPELDHHPQREGGNYLGAWQAGVGKSPEWPVGHGKRIFAYLKPFRALPELLKQLGRLEHQSLIHIAGANAASLAPYESRNVKFDSEPLELHAVGQQCDLAILNGTHGTTAGMLLAGRPTLQIPIQMEQAMTAENVRRLGFGLRASVDKVHEIHTNLHELLSNDRYRQQTELFAHRYSSWDGNQQERRMIDQVQSLLGSP